MKKTTVKIHLTIEEILLFNHFINSFNIREFITQPYCQAFLNIQSKIQSALPEQYAPSNREEDDIFEEVENNILSHINFKDLFFCLLEDWEMERRFDKELSPISNLTKILWGGEEDQTPYIYLERDATPDQIIEAIIGYISEFQNQGAWEIMDAMVQKRTYFELKNLDIFEVIDIFDGVIHNDARPDLDY